MASRSITVCLVAETATKVIFFSHISKFFWSNSVDCKVNVAKSILSYCPIQNISLPLQRKRKFADIIKAFISACFGLLKSCKISPTQNKKAVNARWDMYIPPQSVLHGLLCLVAFHIRRGRSLLILVGKVLSGTSDKRISKGKVPRFYFCTRF